jgi:acetolactate synthase-1/2/3 large subunit
MRFGANVPQVVLRSLQIAKSSPSGPVYLMGARDVMESEVKRFNLDTTRWKPLAKLALADEDAQEIADALSSATRPLIITSYAGKDQRNVALLVELAERLGCGVLESIGSYVNFPASHWAHLGSTLRGNDLEGHIQAADVILVFESDVPWMPHHNKPRPETVVYHIDCNPLKEQMPMHYLYTNQSFRADGYVALKQILSKVRGSGSGNIQSLKAQHEKRLSNYKTAENVQDVITVPYLTACIRDRLEDKSSVIINEATTNVKFVNDHLLRDEPGSLYSSPAASLGWSGGAAIAAKLAHPEKTVVTIVGDGSYLFTVPSTVHWMASRYNTPFLTIILNNRGWRAPKGSTLALYPHGQASIATADDIHCSIDPPPDYAGIARAAGNAVGIKVEKPEEVVPALEAALDAVKSGRQALLDVWLPKF